MSGLDIIVETALSRDAGCKIRTKALAFAYDLLASSGDMQENIRNRMLVALQNDSWCNLVTDSLQQCETQVWQEKVLQTILELKSKSMCQAHTTSHSVVAKLRAVQLPQDLDDEFQKEIYGLAQ